MIGKQVMKEKTKIFFFSSNLFPILNPIMGIEAYGAGILSNQV